jgi:FkbM family methyltransferase
MTTPFVASVPPFQLGVRLLIDPTDPFQMEIWAGAYQPHIASFLRRTVRRGDVVLCAGLHVGYVAALARRLAGPGGLVLTAEPDEIALSWARKSLALANVSLDAPIEVLEAGLSDVDGEMQFYRSSVKGHSSFATQHHLQEVERVALRRGDEWCEDLGVDHLDVMVLDVEGWEMHALRGLEDTIGRSPALLALVECSDWALKDAGSSTIELLAYFRQRAFNVVWASTIDSALPYGIWGPSAESGHAIATDILCVGPKPRTESPRRIVPQ